MVFAAGLGTRMGALTRDRPKPLIEVAGRALIDHVLDLARAAGIDPIVANAHYRANQVEAHLRAQGIAVSHETPEIIDTGGGLRRALPLLGDGPVLTANSDAIWTGANPIEEALAAWDPARMDALLVCGDIPGRAGDFGLDADGRLVRGGRMTYLGIQVLAPAVLSEIAEPVFSLNRVWDLLAGRGRLFGTLHRGGWCDVGTPEGIVAAERMLSGG